MVSSCVEFREKPGWMRRLYEIDAESSESSSALDQTRDVAVTATRKTARIGGGCSKLERLYTST
jgi:hypothetical protein